MSDAYMKKFRKTPVAVIVSGADLERLVQALDAHEALHPHRSGFIDLHVRLDDLMHDLRAEAAKDE
jgi:ribosome assembly protein YihI (activator of Der GTPase)